MHILIDGYNVLKQISIEKEISDYERQKFINQIRHYAHEKKHSISIIFDGGPTTWPSKHEKHDVIIVYSGSQQSADDVIKKIIEKTQKELLLVSSDRELNNFAHNFGVTTIDALSFYNLIKESLKKPAKSNGDIIIKTSQAEDSYIDELMRKSKLPLERKNEIEYYDKRKSPSIKSSKKERALLKKVKKL
jgi:predicted RNA-binding protein with PIN domain